MVGVRMFVDEGLGHSSYVIDLGDGKAKVAFAHSADQQWTPTATLTITNWSSIGNSPGPAASTRRNATVTSVVSDARMASSRAARLFAPPVPRIRPFSGRNILILPVRR